MKYMQLQKLIEGVITDVMPITRTLAVYLEDGQTTLTEYLATLATSAALDQSVTDVKAYTDQKISDLIGGASEDLDTLKEIEDWLTTHHGEYEALVGVVRELADDKVDKVAGKGLSTNDLTDALLAKLNGIEPNANNYVHPATHSAEMITQTTDRNFVTTDEKEQIARSGGFYIGDEAPADLGPNDLFGKIV